MLHSLSPTVGEANSLDRLRRLLVSISPLQKTTLSHISHPDSIQRVGDRRAYPASDAVHHTSIASDYLDGNFVVVQVSGVSVILS